MKTCKMKLSSLRRAANYSTARRQPHKHLLEPVISILTCSIRFVHSGTVSGTQLYRSITHPHIRVVLVAKGRVAGQSEVLSMGCYRLRGYGDVRSLSIYKGQAAVITNPILCTQSTYPLTTGN